MHRRPREWRRIGFCLLWMSLLTASAELARSQVRTDASSQRASSSQIGDCDAMGESLARIEERNREAVQTLEAGDAKRAEAIAQCALQASHRLDDAAQASAAQASAALASAESLRILGVTAYLQGHAPRVALQYLRQARTAALRASPQSLTLAAILRDLGWVSETMGDLESALGFLRDSRVMTEELAPYSLDMVDKLDVLGQVSMGRNDLERARDYFEQAVEMAKDLEPRGLELVSLRANLAWGALQLGDLEAARQRLEKAWEVIRETLPKGWASRWVHINFALLEVEAGNPEEACRWARKALELDGDIPRNLLTAWSYYGLTKARCGGREAALRHASMVLEITQALTPGSWGEALALYTLAEVYEEAGRAREALETLIQSFDALENQAGRLGHSHAVQARFRAQRDAYYRKAVRIALQLGEAELAFHLLERSRSRTLLVQLAQQESAAHPDMSLDLRSRYEELRQQQDDLHERRSLLRGPSAQKDEIDRQLRRIWDEQEALDSRRRTSRPRHAEAVPRALDVEGALAALESGTLLLTFSIVDDRVDVLALDAQGGLTVTASEFGAAQWRRRIADFYAMPDPREPGAPSLRQIQTRLERDFDALLGPVSERIDAADRLLIVPEGPLHELPWTALRIGSRGTRHYLVEHKTLHLAPSVTFYAQLRGLQRQTSPFQVVAFGDPVYSSVTRLARAGDPNYRSIERSYGDLQPLPHSRREVEALADLFPGASSVFLGPRATEETVKELASRASILHFATHGVVDELPVYSSLVLTMPQQREVGQDNGLLQVWEIERMTVAADLVVLSACQSAHGEQLSGEGPMSLTRAFHSAGARSVLATLWKVHDRVTAEIMMRFYRHLHEGAHKDEALRQAQIELIRAPLRLEGGETFDARNPLFWAAFQLYGNWR